jgi:hypothetical protein
MMGTMAHAGEVKRSEDIPTAPRETDIAKVRRARDARRLGLTLLVAVVALGAAGVFGARTASVTASGGGYRLTVFYPATTRPGLAIRWIAVIDKAGGFDGPVRLATTSTYFNLFDFNNLDPTPSSVTTTGELSIWEFEPPPAGDVMRITMDARLEPARQHGSQATTSVLVHDVAEVSVHYQTRVMP